MWLLRTIAELVRRGGPGGPPLAFAALLAMAAVPAAALAAPESATRAGVDANRPGVVTDPATIAQPAAPVADKPGEDGNKPGPALPPDPTEDIRPIDDEPVAEAESGPVDASSTWASPDGDGVVAGAGESPAYAYGGTVPAGPLPFTGHALGSLAVAGLAMLLVGGALRLWAQRLT